MSIALTGRFLTTGPPGKPPNSYSLVRHTVGIHEDLLSERSRSEKATKCMLLPYDILEKVNSGDSKNITGCLGLKGGRDEQVKQRGFLGY